MDTDSDVIMGESTILKTTELNGRSDTIDPSVFTFDGIGIKSHIVPDAPQPLFSHVLSPPSQQIGGLLAHPSDVDDLPDGHLTASSSSTSEPSTDEMEIFPSGRQTVQVVIPPKPKFVPLPYSSGQSGLVYDVRMRFHAEINSPDDIHPEDPRRIHEIYEELVKAGLVAETCTPDEDPGFKLWQIPIRPATMTEICLVHSQDHYKWVKRLRYMTEEELLERGAEGDSIYLHNTTYTCAMLSAGGAIEACRAVITEQVRNAIAVIRPPGHHAEPDKAGGFCFFNNVCVAAKVCQQDFPETCRKILILDWDVHHGNGVQKAFYDNPNVLYISLHVHKNGKFYPQGPYGDHLHCGEGAGRGRNVNIPWDNIGVGDGDYMLAFQQIVIPIASEFDPDLVIVAAGFDAAEGDMLGGCHVSPAGYAHMTHILMSLAKGKVAVCLEGGYNLRSIAKSALAVTRTLMGEPPERLVSSEPTAVGVRAVHLVLRTQSKFWKSLFPKDIDSTMKGKLHWEPMHDIVRTWQSKVMFDEFKMAPLFIRREKLSKSFDNEVLATLNYYEDRPLLVVFHDPPRVMGLPDPRTNELELHNTWLTDAAKTYIDWAIKNGFAVIDVNIPKHITDLEEDGYVESDSHEVRANMTRECAAYLWENYIEIQDAKRVFLMGIGAAYSGIVDLLSTNEHCEENIQYIISFVAENALQPVRRPADDNIASWYYNHSRVFVASNHAVWDPERTRKPKKKYGKLVQSPCDNLSEMLMEHKDQVTELLLEETQDWRTEVKERERQRREAVKANATAHFQNSINTIAEGSDMGLKPRPDGLMSPARLPPMGVFQMSPGSSVSPKSPMRR